MSSKGTSRKFSDIFFTLLFIFGIALAAYPAVSNLLAEKHQAKAISNYDYISKDMSLAEKEKMYDEAVSYNKALAGGNASGAAYNYDSLLNIGGTGIMGYIKIPKINIELPVYHGTSKAVLQVGIGHLEGTSLPVGGKSTHSVLTGHTGLPSSKMFSNIDKLKKGDKFIIKSIGHTMTYKVDDIKVVLPDEVKDLKIVPGKDYCTLVTCTPYGVNDHRLLVRGRRCKNIYPEPNVSSIDPISLAMLAAAGVLLAGLVRKFRKRKGKGNAERR